jgi:hypothetical protein
MRFFGITTERMNKCTNISMFWARLFPGQTADAVCYVKRRSRRMGPMRCENSTVTWRDIRGPSSHSEMDIRSDSILGLRGKICCCTIGTITACTFSALPEPVHSTLIWGFLVLPPAIPATTPRIALRFAVDLSHHLRPTLHRAVLLKNGINKQKN